MQIFAPTRLLLRDRHLFGEGLHRNPHREFTLTYKIVLITMATSHSLKAEKRTESGSGKLNQLRKAGFIPGVVYGAGVASENIKVDVKEFTKMLAEAGSQHMLVDLKPEGASKRALLKEIQHNSLADEYTHVDFLAVNAETEVHSSVPVVLEGDAAGLAMGGMLDQTIHELSVTCKVKDLPESIVINVSSLKVGEVIRLADVKLPSGVSVLIHGETPLVVMEEPTVKETSATVAQ